MRVSDSCPCAAGQLTFCIGEGLEPSVAPFQNLPDCRQECFPLGPIGSSGLLQTMGVRKLELRAKPFSHLWGSKWEFLRPGLCVRRPAHRLLPPSSTYLSGSPEKYMRMSPAGSLCQQDRSASSKILVSGLWLRCVRVQLHGHLRIYSLTKFSELISRGSQTVAKRD